MEPELRDPYESALRRARERREQAAADVAPPVRAPRNLAVKLGLGLVLLGIFGYAGGRGRDTKPPDLPVDCTNPAFALSATSLRSAGVVAYTFVGSDSASYVLAVDARSVRLSAGGAVVGEPAVSGAPVFVTAPQRPAGCRATGRIGLPFTEPGAHTVTMFEVRADGTGLAVASQAVTIERP